MAEDVAPPTPDELRAMPVFPLPDLVLFPGTPVPLRLFEPRYRAMIEDCIRTGASTIATVRLRPGYLADYHGTPAIESIGTVGRITAHRTNADGTHDIVLQGLVRASLAELEPSPRGYRIVRATVLPDEHDEDVPRSDVRVLVAAATTLATRIRRTHEAFVLGIQGGEPASRVTDVLADRFIADPELRQRLLATRDVPSRLELVLDAVGTVLARLGALDGGSA